MAKFAIPNNDKQLFDVLKADGVLVDIDPTKFEGETGAALIFCGDCDQSSDVWNHFQDMMTAAGKPNRLFPVSRAGGAIWVPNSTLLERVDLPRDKDIFFDLNVAFQKKDISMIFSTVHAPCGAAGDFELSYFDQIDLVAQGYHRLRRKYKGQVIPYIHTCYSEDKRRTTVVKVKTWDRKKENYRRFDYSPDKLFKTASL